MQLLIDTAVESAASLRFIAGIVLHMAEVMDQPEASINGPSEPIKLHPHEAASKRPTPPPIGPAPTPAPAAPLPPGNLPPPPVQHPERHPDAPEPEQDPAEVFRKVAAGIVPAGTQPNPSPAAPQTATAAACAGNAAPAVGNVPTPPATAAAATVSNEPVSAERDAENLPWDARIHSDTKKRNADGTWRYRRNLDAAVKAQVRAELLALHGKQVPLPPGSAGGVQGAVPVPPAPAPMPGQSAAAAAVPSPPNANTGAVPVPPAPGVTTSTVVPFPGGSPAVPVPPAPVVGVPNPPNTGVLPAPVTGFRELMTKVNQALATGRLTQAQLTEACKAANVDGITALASQPMKVPEVDQQLNLVIGAAA